MKRKTPEPNTPTALVIKAFDRGESSVAAIIRVSGGSRALAYQALNHWRPGWQIVVAERRLAALKAGKGDS